MSKRSEKVFTESLSQHDETCVVPTPHSETCLGR
jgi:hypothetical protein